LYNFIKRPFSKTNFTYYFFSENLQPVVQVDDAAGIDASIEIFHSSNMEDEVFNITIDEDVYVSTDENDSIEEDSDASINEVIPMPKRHKRILTKNRIINCFMKTLDENNYHIKNSPSTVQRASCLLVKGTKKVPSKVLNWTSQPPTSTGRQDSSNVLRSAKGPINDAKGVTEAVECWQLFFTEAMLEKIVKYSNANISLIIEKLESTSTDNTCPYYAKPTNVMEIKAYFGLCYARGLLNASQQDAAYMFNDAIGHPIFGATMSCKRFNFLSAQIKFDDAATRADRFSHDRFAAMREIFENFNDRCSSVLQPDEYLAIDETLYSCRNQISFKQYNASKPNKYGILYKSVNAVQYPFTFRVVVYSGKPTGEPSPYYVPGILPIVKALVTGLETGVDMSGRNITMDRLYTSYELFE